MKNREFHDTNCEEDFEFINEVHLSSMSINLTAGGIAFSLYGCPGCGETLLKPKGWNFEL